MQFSLLKIFENHLVMGIAFHPVVFKAVGTRVDQAVRKRPVPIN